MVEDNKVYTVWFKYGDNEKDFYQISLPDCIDPLAKAKELDSRIYKIEYKCT